MATRSVLPSGQVTATLSRVARQISPILKCLSAPGEVYLVGGCVRDALLGTRPKEIDLCSPLSTEELVERLENSGIRIEPTGLKHGTVLAVLESEAVEITSFRRLSSPGELGRSINEDLLARDFTVNAIAFDPVEETLIDPSEGVADLTEGRLRCPSNPELVIADDPVRIFRAARFISTLSLTPDDSLKSSATQLANRLPEIAKERTGKELEKLICGADVSAGLNFLRDCNALQHLIPELEPTVGFEQNRFHIHDVYEHTLWVLERCEQDLDLRLAALFHDLGKPETLSVDDGGGRHFYKHELLSSQIVRTRLPEFAYGKARTKRVSDVVRLHMRPLDCGPSGARRLLRDLGENFELWLALKRADAPPKMSEEEFDEVYQRFLTLIEEIQSSGQKLSLALSGKDLIAIGMEPGKKMGDLIKQLQEHIIEHPSDNNKERLIELAREQL